jgi:hypothetical protein
MCSPKRVYSVTSAMAMPANSSFASTPGGLAGQVLQGEAEAQAESEQVLHHLNARGYVPFHSTLAQHLGHKAALFLGLCLYWTRHAARNNPHRQGWVYLSSNDITAATSLTRREQETVRSLLTASGLLEEQLVGRPARMHYRLSLRRLANRLEIIDAGTATPETAWAWFEKSLSFYRSLGDLAGNAAGGLYLSFVLRQQRKALLAGRCVEVVRVEPAEIERALCLSVKTQRNIRQRLMRLGLLTTPLAAASMVRVNVAAILACLRGQDVKSLPAAKSDWSVQGALDVVTPHSAPSGARMQKERALIVQPSLFVQIQPGDGLDRPAVAGMDLLQVAMFEPRRRWPEVAEFQQLRGDANSIAEAAQSRAPAADLPPMEHAQSANLASFGSARSAKLELPARAQTAKLGVPKPPSYIQTGSTNKTTTNGRSGSAGHGAEERCSRRRLDESVQSSGSDDLDGLIFPDRLAAGVMVGLRRALLQAPAELRQQLLDELQGQLRIPTKTIHNPVAWMLGLIRGCAGGAVLALADSVARERHHHSTKAHSTFSSTKQQLASPAVREAELARLHALRREFKLKAGR